MIFPDTGCQHLERRICRVNPVPREVRHRNRRHARPRRRSERQRRHVADDDRRGEIVEDSGFGLDACGEAMVERRRAPGAGGFVEPQTVDLLQTGVRLARLQVDGPADGAFDKPLRDAAPDDDPDVGRLLLDMADDLELARRVAEAVAGDVEDDYHNTEMLSNANC